MLNEQLAYFKFPGRGGCKTPVADVVKAKYPVRILAGAQASSNDKRAIYQQLDLTCEHVLRRTYIEMEIM